MGWIIFGGIVLFLAFLLTRFINIRVVYEKELDLRVKYLFFTVFRYPMPKKQKKAVKKSLKKATSEAEKSAEAEAEKAEENTPKTATAPPQPSEAESTSTEDKSKEKPKPQKSDKAEKDAKFDFEKLKSYYEQGKMFIDSAKKPVKKLVRRIHIDVKYFHAIAGGEDAAAAAISFGKINMIVGNAIGWIDSAFQLKLQKIAIDVDFQKPKSEYECDVIIKARVITLLAFVVTFIVSYGLKVFKNKSENEIKKPQKSHNLKRGKTASMKGR